MLIDGQRTMNKRRTTRPLRPQAFATDDGVERLCGTGNSSSSWSVALADALYTYAWFQIRLPRSLCSPHPLSTNHQKSPLLRTFPSTLPPPISTSPLLSDLNPFLNSLPHTLYNLLISIAQDFLRPQKP